MIPMTSPKKSNALRRFACVGRIFCSGGVVGGEIFIRGGGEIRGEKKRGKTKGRSKERGGREKERRGREE